VAEARPLSILHVALSDGFGGSERYAVDLAAKQQEQGHRIAIVGRRARRGAHSLFDHVPSGVSAYGASKLAPGHTLAQVIAAHEVDILNLHLPDAARAARSLRHRPPAVMTLHLRFKEKEFRKLDGMIRIAHWQEEETRAYDGPAVTALNWPPAIAPATAQEVAAAREMLGAGPDTFVVGFLGRLHAVKRVDLLIEAWHRAKPLNSILALVGDGPERAALERQAHGKSSIRFVGHREDMGVWHRAIDMFALASDWEGLPLGVLEAMNLGTPILATACAGTAEALAGSPAWLVPAGDGPALAASLAAARARFAAGQLPRQAYDLSRFDPAIALKNIDDFYRRVISAT